MRRQLAPLRDIGFSEAEVEAYAIDIVDVAIRRKQIGIGQPKLIDTTPEESPFTPD